MGKGKKYGFYPIRFVLSGIFYLLFAFFAYLYFNAEKVFAYIEKTGGASIKVGKSTYDLFSALSVMCVITAVIFLWKALPAGYRKSVRKSLFAFLKGAGKKLMSIFTHTKKKRKNIFYEDEVRIVFSDKSDKKRRYSQTAALVWKKNADNKYKIRYYFVKYIINRKRRGYKPKKTATAKEIGAELEVTGDVSDLFCDYETAKYSGDDIKMSDESVQRAKEAADRYSLIGVKSGQQ